MRNRQRRLAKGKRKLLMLKQNLLPFEAQRRDEVPAGILAQYERFMALNFHLSTRWKA